MDNVLEFFKKWGLLLTVIFSLSAAWNSCGITNKIIKQEKSISSLRSEIAFNDSLNRLISETEREISENQVAYRVVYDNNCIVRTTARPDDVMNGYITNIKELQNKLNTLKNVRK